MRRQRPQVVAVTGAPGTGARARRPGRGDSAALAGWWLALVDDLLRTIRALHERANAAAVVAETAVDTLTSLRRQINEARSCGDVVAIQPAGDPAVSVRHRENLKRIARNAPVDSLEWSGRSGRRVSVTINRTTLTLPARLATLLTILHEQPTGPDGFAGYIDYGRLRKELMAREGRKVHRHALSQSVGLLAREFEAEGLNPSWIEREPSRRRVRLLLRKSGAGRLF